MDEPSVYLRLKISCPTGTAADDAAADQSAIKPLSLHGLLENIAYDPTTTLIQLVIVDANDNVPVFAEKHIVVGYPVLDVADVIVPKHLVQVKVSALPPRATPPVNRSLQSFHYRYYYCFACPLHARIIIVPADLYRMCLPRGFERQKYYSVPTIFRMV